MKCKHCGAEIIRIDTWGGRVACWPKPVTYWKVRDGHAREVLTPNGQHEHGNLTGELKDAVGVGYLPHTCHQLPVFYKGRDSWSRPVYEDPDGRLLVDVDPREDRGPDICTKQYNAFDGEPNYPVEGDFDFIPCRDTW